MVRFDTVYMAPRVRVALNSVLEPVYARKFWELVDKLRSGRFDLKGLRVEKLHTRRGKVYSARLNVEIRVIFSMFSRAGGRSLVIWDADHHDDAYDRVDRMVIPAQFVDGAASVESVDAWGAGARPLAELESETAEVDSEELADGLVLFEVPHYVLSEPARFSSFERNIDRYLRLTEEQEKLIARSDKAFVVRGSAGTGKTTLALFHALNLYEANPDDDIFFFTYQDELACVCRCYKVNLVGQTQDEAPEAGGLRVFSYLEFCREYLRRNASGTVKWRWVGRQTSLKYLEEIIQSKSRWSRSVKAEDTYSYIYSILKGRLVPGSDRFPESADDYRRIFKGYGTSPKNLEEIMEIFDLYQGRLSRAGERDEADLIRYCYHNMKDSAILSGEKRATWIVIDEIQDFTELEWKSILLFWENKCRLNKDRLSFPFLSGDRNQNISRSGFRWQEAESYVEDVLKKMHRPRSLVKVQLHNNFRNTLEIFNLGKFIRQTAPEASGDLGTPPRFSGAKPCLVVGGERLFVQFLKAVSRGDDPLPAPLVVLFEDEDDLRNIRRQLPVDDGLFLMPLARSKGMEFEDCLIYRLFSSCGQIDETTGQDMVARLFDLWYMAVTRARKGLLVYLKPEDWAAVEKLFGARIGRLFEVVDLRRDNPPQALAEFHERCEKYVPNYNVIFLTREKAEQAWRESQDTKGSDLEAATREALKEQALRLWRKCRDWKSLGQAYKTLGQYEQGAHYLRLANQPEEVAFCLEQLGRFAEAARLWEEGQHLEPAARCFALAGENLRAAGLFATAGQWLAAARSYACAGDGAQAAACFEKAGDWQEAAGFYKLKGQWQKAAELYRRGERFVEAAEMYLKLKDKLDAARCYQAAGQHLPAARLLESLNRWGEAAECYEAAAVFDRALKLYARSGRLKETARCAELAGDPAQAAAAYERMRCWSKAAQIYRGLGQRGKAAECLECAGDWTGALPLLLELGDPYRLGRCLERLGDLPAACDWYLKAGALTEAGYCLEKGGQLQQAADCYLKAGSAAAAAPVLARLGRKMEAARLCLLENQAGAALELARSVPEGDPLAAGKHGDLRLDLAVWAESIERPDLAAAVYEALGHFMLAGQRYRQAARFGAAAACFERDRKLALAAEQYLLDGQPGEAGRCFKQLKQWQKAGQCFESGGQWAAAAEMYDACGDQEAARRCRSSSHWL